MRFFINKINEIKKEYEEERIRKGKKFCFLFLNNFVILFLQRLRLFRKGKLVDKRIRMD